MLPQTCEDGFENGTSSWLIRSRAAKTFTNEKMKIAPVGLDTNYPDSQLVNVAYVESNAPISPIGAGNFALRVGDDQPRGHNNKGRIDSVQKTFTVTQATKTLTFRIAMVLQDPGDSHKDKEKPYFGYMVVKGNGVDRNTFGVPKNNDIIAHEYFIADLSNPYFKSHGNVVYRDWTPYCVDLSNYVGQQVTVIFTASDCTKPGHFGYGYVDQVCQSVIPTPNFDIPDTICGGQDLIADASLSTNEIDHFWSIERSDAKWGRNPSTEVSSWFKASTAGVQNLTEFYASHGGTFQCNTYYRVKLAVANGCYSWQEKVKLVYVQCPIVDAGPDQCCASQSIADLSGNVQATGNYRVEWTPSSSVDDQYSESTKFSCGSISGYDESLTLTVEDELGCRAEDTVSIFNDLPKVKVDSTGCECERRLQATGAGIKDYLWSTNESTQSILATAAGTYKVRATNACGSSEAQTSLGPEIFPTGNFPTLIVDKKVIPSSNFVQDQFAEVFDYTLNPTDAPAYNAYAYQLNIWDRWGDSKLGELQGSSCNGFANGDIKWDGSLNGNTLPIGQYQVEVGLKNCNHRSQFVYYHSYFGEHHECKTWIIKNFLCWKWHTVTKAKQTNSMTVTVVQ